MKETILPAINARGAILIKARFLVGANTLSVAKAIPIEPKLANPIHYFKLNHQYCIQACTIS